jgi:hypothetical protein
MNSYGNLNMNKAGMTGKTEDEEKHQRAIVRNAVQIFLSTTTPSEASERPQD